MRKIFFCLIAALMTTTATAKGGPPTVWVEYDVSFGFSSLVIFAEPLDPQDAGQRLAQCNSQGKVEMLGVDLDCVAFEVDAHPGGYRVITFHVLPLF